MAVSAFVVIVWLAFIIICYYLIRPLPNKSVRIMLTLSPCVLLSYISCQNLATFDTYSTVTVAICWLTSIRLIDMTVFSRDASLTFPSFFSNILWTFFPILPNTSEKNQWPIIFHLILIVLKLLINHWVYRWLIRCDERVSGERVFIFFLCIITISYIMDTGMVLVRLLTRDKYTLESFTNFPLFSVSLREFWGERYNRYVNRVLKESVFEPIRLECSSRTIGGLTTFIISGLLHVHVAYVTFDDPTSLFPTFMFFFLHGIACCLEAKMKIQLPAHVSWLMTQAFLLTTAPLMVKPFIKKGSTFLLSNPPPLLNAAWIPKLPVPNFCPY